MVTLLSESLFGLLPPGGWRCSAARNNTFQNSFSLTHDENSMRLVSERSQVQAYRAQNVLFPLRRRSCGSVWELGRVSAFNCSGNTSRTTWEGGPIEGGSIR